MAVPVNFNIDSHAFSSFCRQVSGELFALTTKYYPYNMSNSSSSSVNAMQVQNFMERKVVSSYDIDMDYNAQPNYIPRSGRNPFMEDYLMTTLKY